MPAEQINKLSRMFQDIKVSQDLTAEFKEALRTNSLALATQNTGPTSGNTINGNKANTSASTALAVISPPINFGINLDLVNVKILSSGAWLPQLQQKISLVLPPELEDFIPQIETLYRQKHQGRSLLWQYHLSHGVLSYDADYGRTEIEVTTFQMAVLFALASRTSTNSIKSSTPVNREPGSLIPSSHILADSPVILNSVSTQDTCHIPETQSTSSQPSELCSTSEPSAAQSQTSAAPLVRISFDSLLTATGLPEAELRRTLWSLTERTRLERPLVCYSPAVATSAADFAHNSEFWLNPQFSNV
ncbi:unnamed protein product [Protopolystoma xenopodis]|uniref:Cullin family profile domain-containing protein n=1 Tax=Protopolystoma xenopodis TaxID=117903 RepID=A0A3S5B841_9PLAT|nr:unnamed protein product [Protopolystoma xenopodis]